MIFLLMLNSFCCFDWSGAPAAAVSFNARIPNFFIYQNNNVDQFAGRVKSVTVGEARLGIQQGVKSKEDDFPPRPRVSLESKRDRPTYKTKRNVVYKKTDDAELQCDIFIPSGDGPFPAILAVHGGAWRSGTKFTMLRHAWRMVSAGYVVVAIDYRHAPKYKFPAQIHDCKHAVRWMRANADAYKIDVQRLGAFGYSAGGHLVALLGTTNPQDGLEGEIEPSVQGFSSRIQCVAAGGAPCEFSWIAPNSNALVYWLGKSPAESPEVYQLASPTSYITKDDPPFFLFHGNSDWVVPWESSLKMHRKLLDANLNSQHEIASGNGHFGTFSDMTWVQQAIVFFDAQLKQAPAPIRDGLKR
ncbi:alpha/beta hydrolase [bacterium]|nr:alpha/beta hydrolase [bacterium]MDB4545191.1 alpha/beta hydrolase [bacterium]